MILLLDFAMPHHDSTTTGATMIATTSSTAGGHGGGRALDNRDRPAIWLLNARSPHTAQHHHRCNCRATGCGEVDVFEVPEPGEERATSAVHVPAGPGGGGGGKGGGSKKVCGERFFKWPVDERARVAVVFEEQRGTVSVSVLEPGMGFADAGAGWGFPGVLSAAEVGGLKKERESRVDVGGEKGKRAELRRELLDIRGNQLGA